MNLTATIKVKDHVASNLLQNKEKKRKHNSWNVHLQNKDT